MVYSSIHNPNIVSIEAVFSIKVSFILAEICINLTNYFFKLFFSCFFSYPPSLYSVSALVLCVRCLLFPFANVHFLNGSSLNVSLAVIGCPTQMGYLYRPTTSTLCLLTSVTAGEVWSKLLLILSIFSSRLKTVVVIKLDGSH